MTTPRYLTVVSYKSWATDETTSDDTLIEEAINAAEEWIDEHAGRSLVLVDGSTVASARVFRPKPCSDTLLITDCAEITSVVENGVTLVDGTDYIAEPLNGVHVATNSYRPYDALVRLDRAWYTNGKRATVTVTGKWGWTSIPQVVVTAARILAADWLANRHVRLGVVGSTVDGFSIGVRQNPNVMKAISVIAGRQSVQVA